MPQSSPTLGAVSGTHTQTSELDLLVLILNAERLFPSPEELDDQVARVFATAQDANLPIIQFRTGC